MINLIKTIIITLITFFCLSCHKTVSLNELKMKNYFNNGSINSKIVWLYKGSDSKWHYFYREYTNKLGFRVGQDLKILNSENLNIPKFNFTKNKTNWVETKP